MCQVFVSLFLDLLLAAFIFIIILVIVIGKVQRYEYVEDNLSLIAVSVNWLILIPSFIQYFMFNFSEMAKNMSGIQRLFYNIDDDH